jgi:excisionase family DNA binding protein
MMSVPDWPTVAEAAKQIGVSSAYIRKMLIKGHLTGRLRGNTWLLDPAAWRTFKAQRAKRLASEQGRADALRVAGLVDSGKMGVIGHDDLVKVIAEKQAHAAVVGN